MKLAIIGSRGVKAENLEQYLPLNVTDGEISKNLLTKYPFGGIM